MARNGTKTGGGSRKGIPNRKTAEKIAAIESSGITPLDYMLSVLRDPIPPELKAKLAEPGITLEMVKAITAFMDRRMDAAKAAAPYVHPRLATSEVKMTVDFVKDMQQAQQRVRAAIAKIPPQYRPPTTPQTLQ